MHRYTMHAPIRSGCRETVRRGLHGCPEAEAVPKDADRITAGHVGHWQVHAVAGREGHAWTAVMAHIRATG